MEHVTKLYGPNRTEAAKMMEAGSDKEEVYKKTGCTVALWDITLSVPKGEIFVIIGPVSYTHLDVYKRQTTDYSNDLVYVAQLVGLFQKTLFCPFAAVLIAAFAVVRTAFTHCLFGLLCFQ